MCAGNGLAELVVASVFLDQVSAEVEGGRANGGAGRAEAAVAGGTFVAGGELAFAVGEVPTETDLYGQFGEAE